MRLRIQEKILIHLYDYRKYRDRYEYPIEITQQGIAKCVGISVTHVPRNIKRLLEEGLVEAKKGHVAGKKKRITVYILTPLGISAAKKIIEQLEDMEVDVGGNKIKFSDLKKRLNLKYLKLLEKIEKGEIDESILGMKERINFLEISLKSGEFVDRDREIEMMHRWYDSGKFLVIVGGPGTGKTCLINRFIESINPAENLVWFNVYSGRKWHTVKEVFRTLFGGQDILTILRKYPTIVVFDGYRDVDDEFVSALNSLVKEDLNRSKIIVSMRSDTPYYNRFYTLTDVVESRVTEIRLEGLPYEDARRILPDVKESAFKRIYQLSKGNPRILMALKNGDIESIDVPLTRDQVHLLKYLATQKSEEAKS